MILELTSNMAAVQQTGKVKEILVEEGQEVKKGDTLLVLEGGKVAVETEAIGDGIVEEIFVEVGQEVDRETIVMSLKVEAEADEAFHEEVKDAEEIKADLVVLGGGPGGYVAAIRASQKGLNTVLIEGDSLGGTCLNRGCIPTKSMVHSTNVLNMVKKSAKFGIEAQLEGFNFNGIMARQKEVVANLVNAIDYQMNKHNIKVIKGFGKAHTKDSVIVNGVERDTIVKFDNLIIATGSVVTRPNIPGINEEDILTSDELLTLEELPKSLIIMGGRVIAMEFAFIYNALGVDVTVIQRSNTIFPNLDKDVIEIIRESAIEKGIRLIEGTTTHKIEDTFDGGKAVFITHNGEEKIVTGEKFAVATGRGPNLEGLDLEIWEVELDDETAGIKVNEKLETSAENIYAIGDVTNIYNLAHVASKHGLVAVEDILGNETEMDYSAVPEAVFTTPEIGIVGMSEKDCEKAGIEIEIGKFPYTNNSKAAVEEDTAGFIKVIADKNSREILGAALIGNIGTELLSTFTNLIKAKTTVEEAQDVIYAHPTVSETAFESLLDITDIAIHL